MAGQQLATGVGDQGRKPAWGPIPPAGRVFLTSGGSTRRRWAFADKTHGSPRRGWARDTIDGRLRLRLHASCGRVPRPD
jgi:hypothetical protein